MGYSTLCSLQPNSKISQCLKEASQYHAACVSGGVSGVSSGCGNSSLNTSLGASPYRKDDDRVYINSGGEIPFNGKVWNGKCYAYYVNGVMIYFTDTNGNRCCEDGHLGRLSHFFKERFHENYEEINGCCIDKFEETIEEAPNNNA